MAAPEASLEALVKDELRGPVSELVRKLVPELVAEQLNGYGGHQLPQEAANARAATPDPGSRERASTTKTCTLCHRVLPASSFDRHRNQCKECRRDRERRRSAATTSDDEPAG